MKDIPMDAKVQCTDGRCGRSTYVIVNPVNRTVTHFVVKYKKLPENPDRLVPVAEIVDIGESLIRLRKEIGEQAELVEHLEGPARAALSQDLVELLEDPGRAAPDDLTPEETDGLAGVGVDPEIEPGRERNRPKHAHRVLAEAHGGIADGADRASLEVPEAADPVDHGEVGDVVEESVDREVPAEGVLLGGPKGVVATDEGVSGLGLRGSPKGRDLDHLLAKPDVDEAKASTHDETVPKELPHLLGVGAGADIEVLGSTIQQQVANPTSDEIGHETMVLQAIEDLECLGIDVLARDDVFGPRKDARRNVSR